MDISAMHNGWKHGKEVPEENLPGTFSRPCRIPFGFLCWFFVQRTRRGPGGDFEFSVSFPALFTPLHPWWWDPTTTKSAMEP